MIPDVLAWLVVLVAFPLNLIATIVLIRLARANPGVRVLRERSYVAIALLMIVTVFAVVFLNNGMEIPVLNGEDTKLITRSAVLALALPAAYWLWLYRNGRRDETLNELLAAASTMVPEAVVSIDEASIILFANDTAHALFGYELGTLQGQSLTALQPERYRAAHRDAMRRYLAGGKRSLNWDGIKGHGLRRDGTEFPALIILNEDLVRGQRVFTGVIRPRIDAANQSAGRG